MTFHLLSWPELHVLSQQYGYYCRMIPFCNHPCSSPSPRNADQSLASPSREGQSPYAGVPRDQWKSIRKIQPSNAN